MSVCPSTWNNPAPTGRILIKFDIWTFFQNSVEKIQVLLKSEKKRVLYTKTFYIYDNILLYFS
jgi:hypothetical protein